MRGGGAPGVTQRVVGGSIGSGARAVAVFKTVLARSPSSYCDQLYIYCDQLYIYCDQLYIYCDKSSIQV
jgi:hypothetical protein